MCTYPIKIESNIFIVVLAFQRQVDGRLVNTSGCWKLPVGLQGTSLVRCVLVNNVAFLCLKFSQTD